MPRAGNLFKNCTIKWYTEDTADTENGFFQKWKKGKKKKVISYLEIRDKILESSKHQNDNEIEQFKKKRLHQRFL